MERKISNCNFLFYFINRILLFCSNIFVIVAFHIIRKYALADCVGVLSVWGRTYALLDNLAKGKQVYVER